MSNERTVLVPRGYALTLTANATSAGSYYQKSDPGGVDGAVVSISAAGTATIGPFNDTRSYVIQSDTGDMGYSIDFSGTFTAAEEAGESAALDLKANLASPTFTGTVVLPSTTSIGTVSSTEIGYLDSVTSAIQTQLNAKQAVVSGVDDTEIGYLNGVTSAIQTQMDLKAPLASPTFTGTVVLPSGQALIAPALGTVASGNISACTSTSMVLTTPLLGTPTSGVLTNCTGLPIAGGGTGASTAAGALANLNVCAFVATLSANPTDVTGDGTQYNVAFNTAGVNIGSGFNTSTGIFTAPFTGLYFFSTQIAFLQTTASTSLFIEFLVNGVDLFAVATTSSTGDPIYSGSTVAQMTQGQTARVNIAVSGTTKTVDINKNYSKFSGFLIG